MTILGEGKIKIIQTHTISEALSPTHPFSGDLAGHAPPNKEVHQERGRHGYTDRIRKANTCERENPVGRKHRRRER